MPIVLERQPSVLVATHRSLPHDTGSFRGCFFTLFLTCDLFLRNLVLQLLNEGSHPIVSIVVRVFPPPLLPLFLRPLFFLLCMRFLLNRLQLFLFAKLLNALSPLADTYALLQRDCRPILSGGVVVVRTVFIHDKFGMVLGGGRATPTGENLLAVHIPVFENFDNVCQ